MKVWDPNALGLQILRVNGVEAKLRCPFHNDNTPSAMFNLSNGLFHCFGCGHSANVFQIAKEFGGELAKIELSSIPRNDYEQREWIQLMYSSLGFKNEYLAKRHIAKQQIEDFKIMESSNGVLFPIYDKRCALIGIQERRYTLEPKYMLHGDRTPVWPMKNLKYENLFLVEGVFGVLRADLFGYKAVCTMGAMAIPQAAKILEGHNVSIMFDDDLAGYLGAYSFMKLHRTSGVILPGHEVDELEEEDFSHIVKASPSRDLMGWAIKRGKNQLIAALRKKDGQNEKRFSYNSGFGTRNKSKRRNY